MIGEIEIKDLYIPQGFLPRIVTGTKPEKVEEYAEMILNGVEFDPIKVWKNPKDGKYWVADGNHRIQAHLKVGKETIKAKFIDCKDELDFRRQAIAFNLKHGIPLTKEEKIENMRALYLQGDKPEDIAKLFGVAVSTVYNHIKDLKDKEKAEREKLRIKALEFHNEGKNSKEISEILGVPEGTVKTWIHRFQIPNLENETKNNELLEIPKLENSTPEEHTPQPNPEPEEQEETTTYTEPEDNEEDIPSYMQLLDPDEVARKVMEGLEDEEEEQEEKPKKRNQPNVGRPKEKTFDALEELETYANEMQAIAWKIAAKFGKDKAIDIVSQILHQLENNVFEDMKVSL